jgi:zinc protease
MRTMGRGVWVLLLLLLVPACAAAGASSAPAAQTTRPVAATPQPWTRDGVTTRVLPNGLLVAVRESRAAPVAAFRIYVKTGSMYEGQFLGSGISHIFEHLIAGGTTSTRSEEECGRLLQGIGAQTNAYTTLDHTCYHGTVLAKHLPALIPIMADWMKHATFPQAEFDRELQVVTREIEMGENDPQRVFRRAAMQNAFRVHPIRHPVIGYPALFAKLTRDDVVRYYQRMYTPNNMIVVAVGDFDGAAVLRQVEEAFGDFERHSEPLAVLPQEPPQLGRRYLELEAPVQRATVMMAFHTVGLTDPDMYPLDLISFALTEGESSRLVRRLRDAEQLVYSVQSFSDTPSFGCGTFVLLMNLPVENVARAERAVMEELRRFRDEPLTAAELQRLKKQKVADNMMAMQSVEDQAAMMGIGLLGTGDPLFNDVYTETIQATRADEIVAAAKRYFRPENLSVTVLRPPAAGPESGTATQSAASSALRRFVLPNGLVVLLKRNPSPKLVAIQTYFGGGVRSETEETNGLCRLTAEMLTKGTATRSAQQIAEFFDRIGGAIDGGSGRNTAYLTATVLSADFEDALAVYADCLLNSTFPEDELAKLRARTLAAIDQINDEPFSEAQMAFFGAFFKRAPYRFDPLGSRKVVEAAKSADLRAYAKRWFVANNAVMALVGDIDLDRAEAAARRLFAALSADPAFKPPVRTVEPPIEKDTAVTHLTNKQQAVVWFGFRGLEVQNLEDRFAADVLDAVLSGAQMAGGRLYQALRGAGLVYQVQAINWMGVDPGYLGGLAVCRPEKVEEVIAMSRRVLDGLKSADLPDEELRQAQQVCISARTLARQADADLAADAALSELQGLGADFERTYPDRISAVTKADVRRVAEKYLTHWLVLVARPGAAPAPEK